MDRTDSRAGIEVYGRVIRYAEVAGVAEGAPRLVRLGACDFDFDVAEALFSLSGSVHLDTVATALREIFAETPLAPLAVAVHPWRATSFFSPLPRGMTPAERFEQLRQEAAMLSDASVSRPVRVRATPVRIQTLENGREVHWHHVLRLPDTVHARFAHVVSGPSAADDVPPRDAHGFVDTTAAAAAVAGRITAVGDDEEPPLSLAVGLFDGRFELALCRGATWYFGYGGEAEAHEVAYYAGALLGRIGVEIDAVERLFVYGENASADAVADTASVLECDAEPLNPLGVFGPVRSGADPFALSAYAPVIGALLTPIS
jgi:hypothetical protein